MTTSSMFLPEHLYRYMIDVSVQEAEPLGRLRAETAALDQAHYQIAPEQGQLLTFIIEMIDARRGLDIGTFTGYSALVAALAMGQAGRVTTLDVSDAFTDIARRSWQAAGVDDRITLELGPAIDSLDRLVSGGQGDAYDFAFIDADKEAYGAYYDRAMVLVRPGGVIAIDNTLWRGRVADPADRRPKTEAMRSFNSMVHADHRVTPVLVPMGDGVTLARKRG